MILFFYKFNRIFIRWTWRKSYNTADEGRCQQTKWNAHGCMPWDSVPPSSNIASVIDGIKICHNYDESILNKGNKMHSVNSILTHSRNSAQSWVQIVCSYLYKPTSTPTTLLPKVNENMTIQYVGAQFLHVHFILYPISEVWNLGLNIAKCGLTGCLPPHEQCFGSF